MSIIIKQQIIILNTKALRGRNTARSLSRNLARYNPQHNEWNCDSKKNRDGRNCERPTDKWNIPQYNNNNNHHDQYDNHQFVDGPDEGIKRP